MPCCSTTPILLVGMHLVAGPLERRTEDEQASIAHAGAVAGDLLTGLRTLKGLGAEAAAVRRFAAANNGVMAPRPRACR